MFTCKKSVYTISFYVLDMPSFLSHKYFLINYLIHFCFSPPSTFTFSMYVKGEKNISFIST